MKTNRKFFINHSIHTESARDDIANLLADYGKFAFVENEKAEAIAEISTILEEYNDDALRIGIASLIGSSSLLDALIPSLTLTEKEKQSSHKRAKAIRDCISYEGFRLAENNGKYEIKAFTRAITIRDVLKYLESLEAFKMADGKITKEGRERARRAILPLEKAHGLALFTYGAYKFENITESVRAFAPKVLTTEEQKALFIDAKPSKSLAEKQIKALAEMLKVEGITYRRVHGLALYKMSYKIDRKTLKPSVMDALDVLQGFIIVSRYAKNGIDLPEIDNNTGIFYEEPKAEEKNIFIFS